MPDPASSEETQNTEPKATEAPSNPAPQTIPKSRFDEVNNDRKALKAQLEEQSTALKALQDAQLSAEQLQAKKFEDLNTQAGTIPGLNDQIAASRGNSSAFAEHILSRLNDDQRAQVESYCKARKISKDDPVAMAQEAMALQDAGMLGSKQKPTVAVHSGSAGRPNGVKKYSASDPSPEAAQWRFTHPDG